MRCFSLGCQAPAVNALYLGKHWPDGRRMHVTACLSDTPKVFIYQRSLGVEPELFRLDEVEVVNSCAACWGSHGCDMPSDHKGIHICGTLDPDGMCCTSASYPGVVVFHCFTFKPCAPIGGVAE